MDIYTISKEESERINILKYIAIILVVFIHAYATEEIIMDGTDTFVLSQSLLLFENLISQTIARCGVPLFFFISSVLLFRKQRKYSETIFGKIRTLLVPYLIWNSLWVFIFILLQNIDSCASFFSGNNTPILQRSLPEWLELYGIGRNLPCPQNYPLWFLRDLMITVLFFPVIEIVSNRFPKQLLAGSVFLLLFPVEFPLKQAVLWFCLGASIVKLQIHITALDGVSLWKLSLIYLLCTIITWITENTVIDVLFIFLGMAYWVRVTKAIFDIPKYRTLFLELSKWTFMIYVAHELTLTSLKKICWKLLPTEPIFLLIEYIFLPVAVIAGCSIFGAVFKKCAPWMYSVSTGER